MDVETAERQINAFIERREKVERDLLRMAGMDPDEGGGRS